MSTVIHIGGAKGVGKTTLLARLNGAKTKDGVEIRTIHMSKFLRDLSVSTYSLPWGELDDQKRKKLRVRAAKEIKDNNNGEVVLLDSHCVDMKDGNPVNIMPTEFEDIIDAYVVLTANAEDIYKRRCKDCGNRARNLDMGSIKVEVKEELAAAQSLGSKNGRTPVLEVENDNLEDAMVRMLQTVDSIIEQRNLLPEGNGINGYENQICHNERI